MHDIRDIPAKQLTDGVAGHYVHGERLTLGLVQLQKGSSVPLHSHPHEQITFIVKGSLQMEIGGTGYLLKAGMYQVIPSGVLHSALAPEYCEAVDVFNPVREDYKAEKSI
jgi:quercetin dioxygenase-like cupin family protein